MNPTLLSAGMAKAWLADDSSDFLHGVYAIRDGHSVCLPVAALREIVVEMRDNADCGIIANRTQMRAWADTINKLLPAKEG